MYKTILWAQICALSLGSSAFADQVFTDDIIMQENACVGTGCVSGEVFPADREELKVKGTAVQLTFHDTSPGQSIWEILTNRDISDGFHIDNFSRATIPFSIAGDAPTSSLVIAANGSIGLGSFAPAADLHVTGGPSATIRLNDISGTPYSWEMGANEANYFLYNVHTGAFPLLIESGAESGALNIEDNGNVGLGTMNPSAPLELATSDSFNFFRITAFGATNDSVDITYTGGPLGTGQLRYNIVDGDNQEMSLDADGNMILDGTLTTSGPTCAGGCDRVFDADYALPSIEDHANAMFANRHLPAVGPTLSNASVNVTEKVGNVINELEHAHIYISQLNTELSNQAERIDLLTAQLAEVQSQLRHSQGNN